MLKLNQKSDKLNNTDMCEETHIKNIVILAPKRIYIKNS